jgi:outer membrane lipopolysaccharide assembly protein LptE/RlpB
LLGGSLLRRSGKTAAICAPHLVVPVGAILALAVAVAFAAGCGYHVAGTTSNLPPTIHTIAVPAFQNKTNQYRIEQRLTEATVHEFLVRTRYRIVPDAANADAVVRGKVVSVETNPLLFDTATGRATTMIVSVKCEVSLQEVATKRELFRNDNFLFRNEYEISTDVKSFFEEQDPALDRLARDFASRLVAAITEKF